MQYRLRTLLLVVTVAGLLFARVAYLKRMAGLHRREADRLILRLSESHGISQTQAEKDVAFIVSGGSSPIVWHDDDSDPTHVSVLNGKKGRGARLDTVDDWKSACEHQIIAGRFDRAVFRPWMLVGETP